LSCRVFLYGCDDHPALHSFPTRRSSDLLDVGAPFQMLAARPDIRQASFQLISAEQDVKAARASFLPSVVLSPYVGLQTFSFNKRSEEHTSELQSRENLVCRLLLEKKKKD